MQLITVSDIQRDLARAVREERLRRNVTQKELAQRAQVGELTVRRLESGHAVSLPNFLRIALALGAEPTAEKLLPSPAPQVLEDVLPVGRKRARKPQRDAKAKRRLVSVGSK